jgi:hypothetical protein
LGGKRDIGANESTLGPWSQRLNAANSEDGWAIWDQNFNFPVVWFGSAAGARINRAHCCSPKRTDTA